MKIVNKKIADLKPYENNARTHPKKQIDLLVANIKRFGFTTPILINKENVIIAGHGRLLALQEMGETTVPCVPIENLTPEEEKALRLADNQIMLMGENDMALVTVELEGLTPELIDLTGFDKELVMKPEEPENLDADDSNKKPRLVLMFATFEDMENAKEEIEEIMKRYEGSYVSSVGGGEL